MNSPESIPAVEYIDMTPTWREMADMLFIAIRDGNSTAQNVAHAEMKRMGDLADFAAVVIGGKRRPDAPTPMGQSIGAIVNACNEFVKKQTQE